MHCVSQSKIRGKNSWQVYFWPYCRSALIEKRVLKSIYTRYITLFHLLICVRIYVPFIDISALEREQYSFALDHLIRLLNNFNTIVSLYVSFKHAESSKYLESAYTHNWCYLNCLQCDMNNTLTTIYVDENSSTAVFKNKP